MSRHPQQKRKNAFASYTKIAVVLLAVFFALPIIFKTLGTIGKSRWDGTHHITIVVDNGDLAVWSAEPSEQKISLIVIPKNTYLTIPAYGPYKAGSIGRLSLLEKKDASLLAEAISTAMGVPVDGAIAASQQEAQPLDLATYFGMGGLTQLISKQPFTGRNTDLTFYDVLRLWLFSFSLRKEAVRTVTISDSQAAEPIVAPDGTGGFILNRQRFTLLAAKYFEDKAIKEEHLTIEVINDTNKEGLANNLALLLSNMGATVINVAKGEGESATLVYSKNKSYTAEKIVKIVGAKVVHEKLGDSRADISVVLGEKQ